MIVPVSTLSILVTTWQLCLSRHRSLAAALGILVFGTLPSSVVAQEGSGAVGDILTAVIGYSITTDSNLFRRPSSGNPRSDVIHAASGTLRFDKPYSQQRFQLEVTETLNRYRNSSYLNFDATSYRGAWLWSPTPWLNASFSADRSKSLAAFEDTLGTQRNVSISEHRAFNLGGRIFGGWNWLAGFTRSDQKSEQAIVNQPDQRTDSADVGVNYITPSGNSITATRSSSKGNYRNQSTTPGVTGNDFKEDANELKGDWKLSEKSELTGRLARLKRTNNQIGQRDFSGPSADLRYIWKPTGKLSFDVSASRKATPLQDPSFSYSSDDSVALGSTWRITEKIVAHMSLTHSSSDYKGDGVVPPTGPPRRDMTNSAELGANWSPTRKLSIKTSLKHQRRSSNNALAEYGDNIGVVSASWMF